MRREERDRIHAQRLTRATGKVKPKALPLASYGLPTITCDHGFGQLLLSTCVRRWNLANGSGVIKSTPGTLDAEFIAQLRASACRRCEPGAARAGKPVPPRKRVTEYASDGECATCGREFSPDIATQLHCMACLEKSPKRDKGIRGHRTHKPRTPEEIAARDARDVYRPAGATPQSEPPGPPEAP